MERSTEPPTRRVWSNPLPHLPRSVAIAPSGQRVAAATALIDSETAGSLTVYNVDGRVIRHTHDNWAVWSVAFSPDSQSMATAEFSRTGGQEQWRARVLEVESGNERCHYLGELHPFRVEFGPDGAWVLAFGDAPAHHPGIHRLRAWTFDTQTGRERWTRVLDDSDATACSPDAQSVAVANPRGVTILDATTGRERTTLTTSSSVGAIAYTPDGRRLVAGCGANRIRAFDLGTGVELWANQLVPSEFGLVRSITCSGDGRWVATLVGSGAAVLDLDDGTLKYPIVGGRGQTRVLYSPTLRSIIVTASEGDPDEEEPVTSTLTTIDAHRGGIVGHIGFAGQLTASVAADGRTLLIGGERSTGGVVEMHDTGVEISRHQSGFALTSIEMSTAVQPVVAVADASAAVTVLTAATGAEVKHQPVPGTIAAIVFADDAQAVAVGGSAGLRSFSIVGTRFWKVENIGEVNGLAMATGAWIATAAGRTVRLLASVDGRNRWPAPNTHPHTVSRIAASSDGRWVGTGCLDRGTRIPDATTGTETFSAAAEGKVRVLAFQQAGALLASGNEDGTVLLIDAETLTQRRVARGFGCSQLAFSADATLLAVSWDDKAVAVYDLTAAGDPPKLQEFRRAAPISALAFHPTDNSVAVAAGTTYVALHDPHSGAEVARYLHPKTVRDFAFATGGAMLATAADNGVRVWSSPPLIDLP
ncbi:MAG: WD40 repeat domain-containing protein [Actinophytocola sp.]|uniref:WD40 repeat domain-containing protein n=1 Tax=Actinophytocola sp. TaxID=1872138 RepID=UPI003D6C44B4